MVSLFVLDTLFLLFLLARYPKSLGLRGFSLCACAAATAGARASVVSSVLLWQPLKRDARRAIRHIDHAAAHEP